jgi:hypothetical protein
MEKAVMQLLLHLGCMVIIKRRDRKKKKCQECLTTAQTLLI